MSIRKGNYLEILAWYIVRNIDVGKVVKENAPANHQLTSPNIQKQIVSACTSETTKAIICDIGDKYFSLLLDEARDNSVNMQVTNTVGASCKRRDELRQKQHDTMVEQLENGHINIGRGLNQEMTLARPGDTRWGSHYKTIIRLLSMWSSVIKVLTNIYEDGSERKSKGKVVRLIDKMEKYEFVFIAHLMKLVLAITNSLSQFLQQKDRDIIEVMHLVSNVKIQLQNLRENGWDELLEDVSSFCLEHNIVVPNMEDNVPGRIRCKQATTYYHHFRVVIFVQVVDRVSQEMDNRFSESNTELLMCIACLDPRNAFSNFSLSRAVRLKELYPQEFALSDQMDLKDKLKMWVSEMRRNETFAKLHNIGDLAKRMVEVEYHRSFPLVYLLIELILVLLIAIATVKRAFSAMNIIKSNLRNKMGDEFLTDCLVCYIEKELFTSIDNEIIIQHFQNMKIRRTDLPRLRTE